MGTKVIFYNEVLKNFTPSSNIMKAVKSRRKEWAARVTRREEMRNTNGMLL
jgi:hypothetical protein